MSGLVLLTFSNTTIYIPHLKVVHKAQTQLPHSAFSYNEHEGCVVLSCFAGSNERRDGGGLPVAVTFSTYYDRAAALKDEVSTCDGLNMNLNLEGG